MSAPSNPSYAVAEDVRVADGLPVVALEVNVSVYESNVALAGRIASAIASGIADEIAEVPA